MSREIPLTQGQVAVVDECDYEWVAQYKWYALWSPGVKSFYAVRNSPTVNGYRTAIQMHRAIMEAPKGLHVDHLNHETLDNRRSNLRVVSCRVNNWNRKDAGHSAYPGVSWHSRDRKWVAQIEVAQKHINLGYFDTEEEAHAAHVAFCRDHGLDCPA